MRDNPKNTIFATFGAGPASNFRVEMTNDDGKLVTIFETNNDMAASDAVCLVLIGLARAGFRGEATFKIFKDDKFLKGTKSIFSDQYPAGYHDNSIRG